MNDLSAMPISETIMDQISTPQNNEEKARPSGTEDAQKLIPRHQNKMVAEKTSDMYMSGLMCE